MLFQVLNSIELNKIISWLEIYILWNILTLFYFRLPAFPCLHLSTDSMPFFFQMKSLPIFSSFQISLACPQWQHQVIVLSDSIRRSLNDQIVLRPILSWMMLLLPVRYVDMIMCVPMEILSKWARISCLSSQKKNQTRINKGT